MNTTGRYGAAAFFAVLTSCAHHDKAAPPSVGTTTTTGAAVGGGARTIMNDDAAMQIADARCERDKVCRELGPTGTFSIKGSCERAMFDEAWAIVRDEACPAGVDDARLSVCLTEARNERCDGLGRPLQEIPSCRGAALCAAP